MTTEQQQPESGIDATPRPAQLATRVETPSHGTIADLAPMPVRVGTPMDPRLQLAIANRSTGKPGLALASTDADQVAVVARVTSPDAWAAIPAVMPGSTMGRDTEETWIVTGRIPIARAEATRRDPCVLSMKAARPVRPALHATLESMRVRPQDLAAAAGVQGGDGVVIGIVDFGCDYAHANFRTADGASRIERIWDQAGVARPDSPFGYGRVHTAADIDAALADADPYATLAYAPPQGGGAHGTHVMDIAAGNGLGSGQPGVAPQATIVFVEASTSDIAWVGAEAANQSLGDSVHLLEAVRHIFDIAGDRPCVVNLSLGTNGGPHDGTSLVERGLDAMLAERPNRAIVIAAGNAQDDGIHASGTVAPGTVHEIAWAQNGGGGEFELWYPGDRSLAVSLVAPDGTVFGPVSGDDNLPIGSNGRIAIFISSRHRDPNNGDNMIDICLAEDMSFDPWRIRLESLDGQPVDYHAWIERMDFVQSRFADPVPTHTLGSISTGHHTIAVGSYDAHKPATPLSSFSSSGPTRDGREKPEISAPGHAVMAARSRTRTGVVAKSGTSMAAPAVTGLAALILGESARRGVALTIAELRDRIATSAQVAPPVGGPGAWDMRYGVGRADGSAIG